jgi:ribosome biogenesis protein Tsr3
MSTSTKGLKKFSYTTKLECDDDSIYIIVSKFFDMPLAEVDDSVVNKFMMCVVTESFKAAIKKIDDGELTNADYIKNHQ